MVSRTLTLLSVGLALICLPVPGQQPQDTNTSGKASIEGKTMSIDGQPLRKTNLTLRPVAVPNQGGGAGSFQPPTPYATTSDAAGDFSFTGLDAGRYILRAEHTGYIDTIYGMKRTGGGVMTGNSLITLTAGQHMTGINLELAPQATISGKVTDEDGDPMPRVRVSAVRKMYGAGGARIGNAAGDTTNDNGDFHLTGLQAGRYYVLFTPLRMGPLQATRRTGADAAGPETGYGILYFPGAPDMDTAAPVDAIEGQDKAGINVQMRKVPVFHVRGTIGGDLSASNSVQVRVTPVGGGPLGIMQNTRPIDPDGSFDTGGLTPGVYTVSVIHVQGQAQTLGLTTVAVGDHDVADLKLMAKTPVDIAGSVRIVPEAATAGQQGQASTQQSPPPPRVQQVSLDPVDGFGFGPDVNTQPGRVQSDGSFTIKNVPPVRFRVYASMPRGGYIKSATLNGQDALAGMDMSSGGKLDIVVSMTAAEVDGTVNNADGQAVTDAMVVVVPDPAQPGRQDLYSGTLSHADGSYSLASLAPGKYRIYAFEDMEQRAFLDPDYMKVFESLGTSLTVDDNDKKVVALTQISKDQAQDALRRAGR